MNSIFKHAQAFRLKSYRKMLLLDEPEDYAIQDYLEDGHEAQEEAQRMFAYLNAHSLQAAEEAELLLTAFVALQIGFRNWALFQRATDRASQLLAHLTEDTAFISAPQNHHLLCHLLVYLYMETEDEDIQANIEYLMSEWDFTALSEEDRYLQECYEPIRENVLS